MIRRLARRRGDPGFTLIELLVVIVVLGILAGVVVFAVRGAGDKGDAAAFATDEKIIRTAQEAYCARAGQYGSMEQLAGLAPSDTDGRTYKFLSEPSELHSIEVANSGGQCNGWKFEIRCIDGLPPPCVPPNGGGPGAPPRGGRLIGGVRDTLLPPGAFQRAIRLADGDVLRVFHTSDRGGIWGSERWDAGTEEWRPVPGLEVLSGRATWVGSLTLLDDDTVLLGVVFYDGAWFLFDPAVEPAGTWAPLVNQPTYRRNSLRAAPLLKTDCGGNCEKVLAAGQETTQSLPAGETFEEASKKSELFDVESKSWALTGEVSTLRLDSPIVALADGTVLVVGGNHKHKPDDPQPPTTERYFPDDGQWRADAVPQKNHGVDDNNVNADQRFESVVALADGTALWTGAAATELWRPDPLDPARPGTWEDPGDCFCGLGHAAAAVGDGRGVLVAGGAPIPGGGDPEVIRIYKASGPGRGWRSGPELVKSRRAEVVVAVTLQDGKVMVLGGDRDDAAKATYEIWDPPDDLRP